MPTLATSRPRILRGLARLALALTIVGLAASDAPAQHLESYEARNRRFYGDLYQGRGYADSLGLRGHKRCENGGYYGPPQIFSRQYGTAAGYRIDPPFGPLRRSNGAGYSANGR